jgi:hypothetical protein
VFHLNARSVRNQLSYLEDIASESSIICVTESHLDGNILDTDIGIDGFSDKIFRKDRNSFGGGVLVYTSQGICVKERHDLNCDGVEMLWIEVLIPNFKQLVCVVYRPPGTTESFWDNLDYSLEQALNFTVLHTNTLRSIHENATPKTVSIFSKYFIGKTINTNVNIQYISVQMALCYTNYRRLRSYVF